jgi:uncharacterized cupredoxin-like copper-binding protein
MLFSRVSRDRVILSIAGVLAAAGLAACGGDSSSGGGGGPYGAPSDRGSVATPQAKAPATSGTVSARATVSAAADGSLAFNTDSLAAKAGEVTVVMDNPSSSGMPHGIAISGNGVDETGKIVQAGSSSTLKVKLAKGMYVFFCPVPGHEEAGMKGTLTVE